MTFRLSYIVRNLKKIVNVETDDQITVCDYQISTNTPCS